MSTSNSSIIHLLSDDTPWSCLRKSFPSLSKFTEQQLQLISFTWKCIRISNFSQNQRWPQPPLRQITKSIITWKVYNLETHFFPRPMFSRVRNAMKLSFAFYDLSNYLKIQNGRHFWDFTLIREALYFFFLDPCFQGYGMQWSYYFCSTFFLEPCFQG